MDWSIGILPWLVALCTLVLLIHKFIARSKSKFLPPGPPGLPLVGNLVHMATSEVFHRTLLKLKSKHGPVMLLRFGSSNTLVVQSAEAAEELFKKCDLPFADRFCPDALTALGYNKGSIGMGSYSPYWRNVRRILSIEFLMQQKINATMYVRQKSMEKMVAQIKEESKESMENGGMGEIELGRMFFYSAFKSIGNLTLSEEVMESKLDRVREFFEDFIIFVEWLTKPNLADFFPILKWVDPQGIRRNTKKYLEKLMGFTSEIVWERIMQRQSGEGAKRNNLLDALLDEGDANSNEPGKLSVKNIIITLLEMFLAGVGTTSTTTEWAMSELLRNPGIMKKLQDEIDKVVGSTRMVAETDLTNLPYLQAVVKETLRLYPAGPILIPRRSTQDTEFMGYMVPKDTQILVNVWAIHRDPALWGNDPLAFKPERFLDCDVDFKGQHFQMLPFGAGRRICPGMTLGHRSVCLNIANLLQAFDWKLPAGESPETMDMGETSGIVLQKAMPLKAIPTPRVQ